MVIFAGAERGMKAWVADRFKDVTNWVSILALRMWWNLECFSAAQNYLQMRQDSECGVTFLTASGFCWMFPACHYCLISQHMVWGIIWIIFKALIISSVSFVSANLGKLCLVNQSLHLLQQSIRQKTVEHTKIRWEQSTPLSTHDIETNCRY